MVISVMLQIGSYCNNYLIINVIFKRIGVKAGKDFLPFAIFVTQTKKNVLTNKFKQNTYWPKGDCPWRADAAA